MDLFGSSICSSPMDPSGLGRPSSSFVCYTFDPSDLHVSSTATIVVLVRLFNKALARPLPDCLLQQGPPCSGKGEAMTAARLQLAPLLVVIARWSMDHIVIFVTTMTGY